MTNYLNWNQRIFNILFDIAKSVEPIRSARLAAAIVHKNQIISIGTNKLKTDPLQARHNKRHNQIFIHAEVDAIKNARYRIDLSKCDLYVVRAKIQNKIWVAGFSKPCVGCQEIIEYYQLRNVFHT